MAQGKPIDSNHPGFDNLTEHEKDKFRALEEKDPESFTPKEKALNDRLKDLILHGSPLNRSNPSFANLSPKEAEIFDALDR